MKRVFEYIFKESVDKTLKTEVENLTIRVVDDNMKKGSIFVNDKKIASYEYAGASIKVADIDSVEEFVMAFLELFNSLLKKEDEGEGMSNTDTGGEILNKEEEIKEEEGGEEEEEKEEEKEEKKEEKGKEEDLTEEEKKLLFGKK